MFSHIRSNSSSIERPLSGIIQRCGTDKLLAMQGKLSSTATINDQTERLLGFSDAVFAIAMTFIALDLGSIPIDVGTTGGPSAADYIRENIPDYTVYFATFLLVAFLWWRHHLMFRYIKRTSTGLVWTNTLMLALVAALPYPASVVSEAPDSGLALLMLMAPLALIGILMLLEWEIAVRKDLVIPGLPRSYVSYIRSQVIASPIVLTAAAVFAAVSWLTGSDLALHAAASLWVILAILPVLMRRRWPTPDDAYEVEIKDLSPSWQSLEDTEAAETKRVRGLIARLHNGSDTDRLVVLTDGILAIAVTILALQLRPPPTDEVLTNDVILKNLAEAPSSTYIVTFVLISLFWRGHVRVFSYLKGADPVVLWLNLLFLMFISFLPTAAALQARDESTASSVFYLLMMLFTAASIAALGQYGARARNLAINVGTPAERRLSLVRSLTPIVGFSIALVCVIAFDNPAFGAVVWVVFIVSGRYTSLVRRRIDAGATST